MGRLVMALEAQARATTMLATQRGAGSGDSVLDALGRPGASSEDFGEGKLSGAKGAAAMEAWRRLLREQPQAVTRIMRRQVAEANLGGPESVETPDSRVHSLREYLASNICFDKSRGLAYFGWALATIGDLMKAGAWHEAEAELLLTLARIEQVALDEGRWGLAWILTHLPEPPWARIAHRAPNSALKPFTRLLPPSWAAAAASYVRDMNTLNELKKKSGVNAKGSGSAEDKN